MSRKRIRRFLRISVFLHAESLARCDITSEYRAAWKTFFINMCPRPFTYGDPLGVSPTFEK